MNVDPFRSRPVPHPSPFAMSRRLERTILMVSYVLSAVSVAFFYGSVGGGIFSSPGGEEGVQEVLLPEPKLPSELAALAKKLGAPGVSLLEPGLKAMLPYQLTIQ